MSRPSCPCGLSEAPAMAGPPPPPACADPRLPQKAVRRRQRGISGQKSRLRVPSILPCFNSYSLKLESAAAAVLQFGTKRLAQAGPT